MSADLGRSSILGSGVWATGALDGDKLALRQLMDPTQGLLKVAAFLEDPDARVLVLPASTAQLAEDNRLTRLSVSAATGLLRKGLHNASQKILIGVHEHELKECLQTMFPELPFEPRRPSGRRLRGAGSFKVPHPRNGFLADDLHTTAVQPASAPPPLELHQALGPPPNAISVPVCDEFFGVPHEAWCNLHRILIGGADQPTLGEKEQRRQLVALRGPRGSGKTELVAEFIRRWGGAFPGGVYWVDAGGVDRSELPDLLGEMLISTRSDLRRLVALDNFRLASGSSLGLTAWLHETGVAAVAIVEESEDDVYLDDRLGMATLDHDSVSAQAAGQLFRSIAPGSADVAGRVIEFCGNRPGPVRLAAEYADHCGAEGLSAGITAFEVLRAKQCKEQDDDERDQFADRVFTEYGERVERDGILFGLVLVECEPPVRGLLSLLRVLGVGEVSSALLRCLWQELGVEPSRADATQRPWWMDELAAWGLVSFTEDDRCRLTQFVVDGLEGVLGHPSTASIRFLARAVVSALRAASSEPRELAALRRNAFSVFRELRKLGAETIGDACRVALGISTHFSDRARGAAALEWACSALEVARQLDCDERRILLPAALVRRVALIDDSADDAEVAHAVQMLHLAAQVLEEAGQRHGLDLIHQAQAMTERLEVIGHCTPLIRALGLRERLARLLEAGPAQRMAAPSSSPRP
jgi:hypothetical protein